MTRNKASIDELKEDLIALQQEKKTTQRKRGHMESEFQDIQSTFSRIHPSNIKKALRTTGAYILGRRNRKQLYSKAYKSKQASNDLKPYKTALYNQGFIDLAIQDLHIMYEQTNNQYLKQAIAWELVLWFADKQTESGAFQALLYVQKAKEAKLNSDNRRKITIIEAECYLTINEKKVAKQLLEQEMTKQTHPDLYLARANIEEDAQSKLHFINQAFALYDLTGVTLTHHELDYDALQMQPSTIPYVDGPKVSVILPAYNAEEGIQIAIESILGQTWRHLELLIVDDCSSDQTMDVIHTYAQKDDRIKVFSTGENSGPYVARNIALQAATGEFITINDADDWSHQDKLRIQVEHLLKHPNVLANTSEQARLTEDIQFYRRGNPGQYIFSNMSSFLFRRDVVMEKLGFWDTVRFAADGEFIRRFIHQFGAEVLTHLKTGPLSFPRQSKTSLTSNSAFGYSGFLMGVRQEYVESFSLYHQTAKNLYYPPYQHERLFPVPEPMKPNKQKGERHFDLIMLLDMNDQTEKGLNLLEQELQQTTKLNLVVGVVDKTVYETNQKQMNAKNDHTRTLLQRYNVGVIVYGETVTCDVLIIRSPKIMEDKQAFIPRIKPKACLILIEELQEMAYNGKSLIMDNYRESMQQIMIQFGKKGRWYPLNDTIRKKLTTTHAHDIRQIPLAKANWLEGNEFSQNKYIYRLKNWILDEHI